MVLLYFLKIFAAPFLQLFFKPKIYGRKNVHYKGRMIIMSNHRHLVDPILLDYVFWCKRIIFMAKEELFEIHPFVSWFLRTLGAFPIKRGEGDVGAIRYALRVLEQNKTLGIFPEGTRSKTGELLPFHGGVTRIAVRESSPIIPVYIGGAYGWTKRVKVAVGEPIDITAFSDSLRPAPEQIHEITEMLFAEMKKLEAIANQ